MLKSLYQNAIESPDQRAADLLAHMSLDEKVSQLTAIWVSLDPGRGEFAPLQSDMMPRSADTDRVMSHGIGQLCRPFGSRPVSLDEGVRALNALQKRMVEDTRLGIPALVHEECLSGLMADHATQFPVPLNYGATWNEDLIARVAQHIGQSMRRIGVHQGLAPVADITRDPRWGRTEECIGEDPYLAGVLCAAFARGLQGDHPTDGVIATLKHFAGYSMSEGGRNFAPAQMGRRFLEDIVLPPFEMAVREGGALSVMNAYQEIDGEPAGVSRWLLTEVLRERWGFDGVVVADYFTVMMLAGLHRVAGDDAEAAALALKAGLDLELPTPLCYPTGIPTALNRGLLDMSTVDEAVRRVLTLKFRIGLFERPYVDNTPVSLRDTVGTTLALDVARQSITLLKNNGVLPLAENHQRIAVIGPNADDPMALFGDYSFPAHVASAFADHKLDPKPQTILEALHARFAGREISHAQGCTIIDIDNTPKNAGKVGPDLSAVPAAISQKVSGFDQAIDAAKRSDVAILVLGDRTGLFRNGTVGEGSDTTCLRLPGVQEALARAVIDTGTPTILVLTCGRPPAIAALVEGSDAVLQAWFPGERGGQALAEILSGDAAPSGKSTLSYPASTGAVPIVYNQRFLSSGMPRQADTDPIFPFGHGLSYTTFEYSDFTATPQSLAAPGNLEIGITITNTGSRSGTEIVQLYVADLIASVVRPVRELKGFARIVLEPGECQRVSFTAHTDLFSFTGLNYARIVEPGAFRIEIGASSVDIRAQGEIELIGETYRVPSRRVLRPTVKITPA